jgi:kynureninase
METTLENTGISNPMSYTNSLEFSQYLDANDPLRTYRYRFFFPQHKGRDVVYFTGNSLGLQPKTTREHINHELDEWARHGVEGHFLAKNPWFSYHEILSKEAAKLVGATPREVVIMNQLTVNLHLLMVSFYRPTKQRYKILCEYKAFPSDQYVLETQARFHGFDPDDAVIEVRPRDGEHCIRHEDVIATIEQHKDSLAMVLFGGVNYYTGQVFDMKGISEAAHKAGAIAGFDLAHAAGNLKMQLHDWNVDFAAWCSYKYLNSGPGSVAGIFVHEKHLEGELPRFGGWWGHSKEKRFLMEKGFLPIKTAEGWALSNAPVFAMAAHKAALDIFDEVGMDVLCAKAEMLTGFLEYIIDDISSTQDKDHQLEIITPRDKAQRGCQLSIIAHGRGKGLFQQLLDNGVLSDWREPNVIRVAPVPLYNSFEDVYRFGEVLREALK